jgi:8-oxo-dGTP pyrophosphatase MutT (NUDIX family)
MGLASVGLADLAPNYNTGNRQTPSWHMRVPCSPALLQIVGAGRAPMLPVLKQFRPPVANYCLELPAGLVDAGESVGQAAVRELLEETGRHTPGLRACLLAVSLACLLDCLLACL